MSLIRARYWHRVGQDSMSLIRAREWHRVGHDNMSLIRAIDMGRQSIINHILLSLRPLSVKGRICDLLSNLGE